jgi:membrane protease YdiL (CAAX protease family)
MRFNQEFAQENPFLNIKVRHIFLCFMLAVYAGALQFGIIFAMRGESTEQINRDPLILSLISILAITFTVAWTVRQLKLAQINLKQIIGHIPSHVPWLPLLSIILARRAFSLGFFYIAYYSLSFIFPAWVEQIISDNSLVEDATASSSPVLYYLFYILYYFILSPITYTFIFQGIILHRWSAKWGVVPAIIMLCLIHSINLNVLGGLSLGLMQTMIYIKSKSLVLTFIVNVINGIITFILFFMTLPLENTLEQFRSLLGIGIVCFAVSTPFLIWVLYKNRLRPNEQLPYFANANPL